MIKAYILRYTFKRYKIDKRRAFTHEPSFAEIKNALRELGYEETFSSLDSEAILMISGVEKTVCQYTGRTVELYELRK